MRSLAALPLAWSIVGPVWAQGVPPQVQQARSKELPLASVLQDAVSLARVSSLSEVRRALGERFVAIDGRGRAHVEIVAPRGWPAAPRSLVARFGGVSDSRYQGRLDAWVPLESLPELARTLPGGWRVERAGAGEPDQVAGQGPAAIGSDGYRNGGANGAGLTIAVIDADYVGLSAARANGDAPALANCTLVNYTPYSFESGGTHGTGCVEAAFDHCPGATWRIYKIDSLADMGTVVSDAIASGVDVISHSLSRYNLGWADDTGAACAAAAQAGNAGIVFCTSAGNRAQQHWQGTFNAGSGAAQWHDWVWGDEALGITLASGDGAGFYLSWNTAGGVADYDLYLYDSGGNLLASSTQGGEAFEEFYWQNSGPGAVTVNVQVLRYSGAVLELEVFGHGAGTWEHFTSASSTTSPSNSTHVNVLAVGAVGWGDFQSPAGTSGILRDYSSHGPSNSGMLLPDLCGPTDTTGFTYSTGFGGTSCATPNAAGALCAHWSSVSAFSGSAERWLYLEQSRLHRDWGDAGPDQLYGQGGTSLVPFAVSTVWLARGFGNVQNLTSGPYYTLAAAYQAVPTGGRILALPGSYPELPVTLTKAHRIEGYDGSALIKN